jgi:hypothetical protein
MASERAGKLIGLSGIILHMWFGICLVSTYGSGIMLESRASKKKQQQLVIAWLQRIMQLVGRASQPLRQDKHGREDLTADMALQITLVEVLYW